MIAVRQWTRHVPFIPMLVIYDAIVFVVVVVLHDL